MHSQSHKLPSVIFFIDVGSTLDVEKDVYLHSAMIVFESFGIEASLR
jgi:hypothetical protein